MHFCPDLHRNIPVQCCSHQNVIKDLAVEMLIATDGTGFPKVGRVKEIPASPTLESAIEVEWFQQETAPDKPHWLRFFVPSSTIGVVAISDIILYDF